MSVKENLRLSEESIAAYNAHDLDHLVEFWADEEIGLARKEWQKNFSG